MAWAGGLVFLFVLCAALVAAGLYFSWIRLPPNWAPWGPVELEEPPSLFARLQINSLATDSGACFAALERSRLQYRRAAVRAQQEGCGLLDAVRIERSQVAYSSGFTASCAMTAALYWYERRLQALARRHFGSGLARIEHLGSYACRNVNAREEARRSQHATANAIDIAGFRLTNGEEVSVLRHWGEESPAGRFLAAAHDAACDLFNMVLGPDYDALHANHFHLDLGRFRICR